MKFYNGFEMTSSAVHLPNIFYSSPPREIEKEKEREYNIERRGVINKIRQMDGKVNKESEMVGFAFLRRA